MGIRELTSSLHQIEALVKAGVKDIVLAVNYRPEVMVSVLKKSEEEFGINIHFSVETEPLGTGKPHMPRSVASLLISQPVPLPSPARSSARTTPPSLFSTRT
jgi:hypothetical protein